MGKSHLIILVFLYLVLSVKIPAQLNDPIQNFSMIEVQVPYSEVYDDGIYRKLYSSFQIFDQDGKKLLSVPEKYDRPAQIKLNKGEYRFIVKTLDGSLIEKNIIIAGNQFEVIEII